MKHRMNWDQKGDIYSRFNVTKKIAARLNQALNVEPLRRAIQRRLGYSGIKLTGGVDRRDCGVGSISIESNDLRDKAGILGKLYRFLKIHDFGSNIYENTDGEICAWVGVHFRWEYHGRRIGGAEIFHAWYNFDQRKWEFGDGTWVKYAEESA
jgi:hypothetical protein